MVRRSSRFAAVAVLTVATLASTRAARADEPLPLVHPIYVHLPDAPEEDALRRALSPKITGRQSGPPGEGVQPGLTMPRGTLRR